MTPKVTFINPDKSATIALGAIGKSVMEAARDAQVDGIVAECGGTCACATCHVYVAEDWIERTGDPSECEVDMLELAYDVRENSRLSCQITMSEALDGLVVEVAARQI